MPVFSNPIMLAGIAAAILPVVLHLAHRSRGRRQAWGAMMFLDGTIPGPSARRRGVALMILRMFIIALLAVALAYPSVAMLGGVMLLAILELAMERRWG
jgi:hypothetical protein